MKGADFLGGVSLPGETPTPSLRPPSVERVVGGGEPCPLSPAERIWGGVVAESPALLMGGGERLSRLSEEQRLGRLEGGWAFRRWPEINTVDLTSQPGSAAFDTPRPKGCPSSDSSFCR